MLVFCLSFKSVGFESLFSMFVSSVDSMLSSGWLTFVIALNGVLVTDGVDDLDLPWYMASDALSLVTYWTAFSEQIKNSSSVKLS